MKIRITRMPANFVEPFIRYDEEWFAKYMADYKLFREQAMKHRKEKKMFIACGKNEKASRAAEAIRLAALCASEAYNRALEYKARLRSWGYNDRYDDCRKENDAVCCCDYPGDGYCYDPGYDCPNDKLPL